MFLIDSEQKILNSLTAVKEDIDKKIENLKNFRLNSLINSDVSNELNVAVNNLESNLKTNFKSLWNENLENNNSLYFPFRVEFSVASLKEGKYNQNYTLLENLIWESICNQFLRDAEKLKINSINDIPNLKNQKEIFMSSNAFDSLISDKNFKFSGQQIEINKTVLNVHYISQKEKCIILPEEIEKSLSITAVIDFQDKAEKIVKNDDVIISVLFHLIIEKLNEKGKVYILG